MKRIAAVAGVLCLLAVVAWVATGPTLTLTPGDGVTVAPDAQGRVTFLARAVAAGAPIRSLALTVPHATATLYPQPPTAWAFVRAAWDTRDDPAGQYQATASATDTAGNVTTQTVTVTLVK